MAEIRIPLPDLKQGRRLLSRSVARAADVAELAQAKAPRIRLLEARALVRDTNEALHEATEALQVQHDATAQQLQRLGEVELSAFDGPIRTFVEVFERLKNVDLTDISLEDAPAFARNYDVDVRNVDFGAVDSLVTLAAGSAAGAAAGLTSLAAVGTLATASTGTAISGLSGAAATNATLAWLGGGSHASGGGGMAAGTMVLGGIVALPVLAVGGLVIHHKGRKALAEAKQDAAQAEVVLKEIQLARTVALGIRLRAKQITTLVGRLAALADIRNGVLRHLVDDNDDYATYSENDRKAVMIAASVVKTLRTIIDVPVINDDGTLSSSSRHAVDAAEELLATA